MSKKLFNKKKLNEGLHYSKNSVKTDKFDEEAFNKVLKGSDTLRHNMHEGVDDYPPYDDLLQDTFSSLYKYIPEVLEEFEIKEESQLNRSIISEVVQSPKYRELRALTKLDNINSTVGTEILSSQLKELLKRAEEQKKAQEELEKAMKDANDAQKKADKQGKGKKNKDKNDKGDKDEGDSKEMMDLKKAKEMLEKARKNFKDAVEDKKFTTEVHNSVANAQEHTQDVSDFITNWGLENDNTFTSSSYKEKMKLLDKIRHSDKLKKITKLAGRYKAMALQRQREKVKKGMAEVYTIKQGKDIERLLPSELMKLNDPVRETLFFKDYFEGKALQYETRSKGKKIEGPIVVMTDSSGSMHGTPEIWSKAVALGMLEIARSKNRDFAWIHFSGDHDPDRLKTFIFKKNEPHNINKVIETVEYFEGGGTNFEAPLARGRQIIDKHPSFTKADMCFITDGESAVGDKFLLEFNEWKKKNKVNITSVLIDEGYSSLGTLKEFTKEEDIFRLDELKEDSADELARQLFEQI